jgi:hypothetical protein
VDARGVPLVAGVRSGEELGFDPMDQIPAVDLCFCGLDLVVGRSAGAGQRTQAPANPVLPRPHHVRSTVHVVVSSQSPVKSEFQIQIQIPISVPNSKIHKKITTWPKITNLVYMESL